MLLCFLDSTHFLSFYDLAFTIPGFEFFLSGTSKSTMKMVECKELWQLQVTIYFYNPE